MIAYLAYKAIRIAAKDPNLFFTSQVSDNLLNGLWVVAGCYALGKVLNVSQLKQFLRILAALWTAGTLIHCGLALYAAWTGNRISNLSGGSIWGIGYYRAVVSFFYPTTSGSAVSTSVMVATCALLAIPSKPGKVYYCLSLLAMIVTLGLTDARTSYVSAAIGIGVAAGCVALQFLYCNQRQRNMGNRKNKVAAFWMISLVCMAMTSMFFLLLFNAVTPAFLRARDHGGVLVPLAKAEESTQKQEISNRGFFGERALSGRDILWDSLVGYLSENPETLIFGDTIYNSMSGPNARNDGNIGHGHNMVLQIVLESGIIGLLFVTLFAVYVAYNAVRLMLGKHVPLWKRVIPAIPVSVLVGDLAECFGWFRSWNSQALVFLFLASGIIVSLGKSKNIPVYTGDL